MKKNLRRLVAFGLTAAMGATMLTGCGGGDKGGGSSSSSGGGGSKDGKVELTMAVWDSDQEPVMQKLSLIHI